MGASQTSRADFRTQEMTAERRRDAVRPRNEFALLVSSVVLCPDARRLVNVVQESRFRTEIRAELISSLNRALLSDRISDE